MKGMAHRVLRIGVLTAVGAMAALGCSESSNGAGGAGGAVGQGTGSGPSGSSGTTGASSTGATGSTSTGQGGGSGTPLFVAVGYGGRRMSSADGIHWANDVVVDPQGGDDDNLFRGVGFVAGHFVAVGGSAQGQNATTSDGASWAFHTPAGAWIADAVPLGSAVVVAGGNGLRQRSLDGGLTWTDAAPYYAGHFRGIASGNGIAVAAGHTYGGSTEGLTSTSTDGKTWSPEVTGGTPFHSIAFGAGVFVAAGDDRCATSTDGKAWAPCGGVSGAGLDRVVFVNGAFVLGDATGYFVSTDGVTFQHQAAEHHAVSAYGLGLYVALDWPDRILTSPDLATWTVRQENTGPAFVEVAFGEVSP
jgi:hypothetical protein